MRNDLSVLAVGTALREIYIVYARLRNALRIIVRTQLSVIDEPAIQSGSPPETQLPRKSTPTARRVTQRKTSSSRLAITCPGCRLCSNLDHWFRGGCIGEHRTTKPSKSFGMS